MSHTAALAIDICNGTEAIINHCLNWMIKIPYQHCWWVAQYFIFIFCRF